VEIIVKSINDLSEAATQLLAYAGSQKIFLFYGDMGTGKTTFIKAICKHLGVIEPTTSPTFSIVNEYSGTNHKIYHFDFYRLKNETEALDMGYEEYFYADQYCFIEWPEKIAGLLPPHFLKVNMQVIDVTTRSISADNV
jgi:tRNA threonylcarbamoyladenosine biosynthesis protein TsaE